MENKALKYYFFILFSLIPISILIGPAMSLSNIILIDLSFLIFALLSKKNIFILNHTTKMLFLLYFYLIFNSIISQDFLTSAPRNFGFIRFIILFFAFNYFFKDNKYFNNIFYLWTLILLIVAFDIFIERFTGTNILGYGAEYVDGVLQSGGNRVVSFFKDEPIVGGYVNAFYLMIVGFLFECNKNTSNNHKKIFLLISVFFLISILLTGERSNAIKALMGFIVFYYLNDNFTLKNKLLFIISFVIIITFSISKSEFLKLRYGHQLLHPILNQLKSNDKKIDKSKVSGSEYINHYSSAIEVFKNYPIFGVGTKNYRVETCNNQSNIKYACSNHPHQILFEFLAEHGLIGSIISIFILFNLIFTKFGTILRSKNFIQIGCLVYLFFLFTPLLPSGAFFADYNLNLFWINLALMYSVGKKTNIYLFNQLKVK